MLRIRNCAPLVFVVLCFPTTWAFLPVVNPGIAVGFRPKGDTGYVIEPENPARLPSALSTEGLTLHPVLTSSSYMQNFHKSGSRSPAIWRQRIGAKTIEEGGKSDYQRLKDNLIRSTRNPQSGPEGEIYSFVQCTNLLISDSPFHKK